MKEHLPIFSSETPLTDHADNSQFVFTFDERKKRFVEQLRLDMELGVGRDLTVGDWHEFMCVCPIQRAWWLCCTKAAKQMFLDEETGLLRQKARYRSCIVGKYPSASCVIMMEAEPMAWGSLGQEEGWLTINRGNKREPYVGQPVIWLPELGIKVGPFWIRLKKRNEELLRNAKAIFYDEKKGLSPFTKREIEVLKQLADGHESNSEIAKNLSTEKVKITGETVKTHRKNIAQKGKKNISEWLPESLQIAWFMRALQLV